MANAAVHLHRLNNGEGPLLDEGDETGDSGGPDWDDADQGFDLLDLLEGAEPPWARWRGVSGKNGCFVETGEVWGGGGGGEREAAVAEGGDEYLGDAGEDAAFGGDVGVERGSDEEEGDGEEHQDGGDGEADGPAD